MFSQKLGHQVVCEKIPLHEIKHITAVAIDPTTADFEDMMQQRNHRAAKRQPSKTFAFQVSMLASDEHSSIVLAGRRYCFRAESKKDRDEWVEQLKLTSARALQAYRSQDQSESAAVRLRMHGQNLYESLTFQAGISFIIMTNFLCNLLAAEVLPDLGSKNVLAMYSTVDTCFLCFFVAEMLFALYLYRSDFF